jgi:hypothetical protein
MFIIGCKYIRLQKSVKQNSGKFLETKKDTTRISLFLPDRGIFRFWLAAAVNTLFF